MLIGAINGAIKCMNRSCWSKEDLFVDYLKHFIKHVKSDKANPILPTLDNNETDISIEALDLAKVNGIEMLMFPLHTSHKLQPLGRIYKTFYNEAIVIKRGEQK